MYGTILIRELSDSVLAFIIFTDGCQKRLPEVLIGVDKNDSEKSKDIKLKGGRF